LSVVAREQAAKLVAEHGGRYLAAAVAPEVVEGDPGLTSVVLIEFPDGDSARAWYESPAYRPLKALRHRAVRNTAGARAGPRSAPSNPQMWYLSARVRRLLRIPSPVGSRG
jgi:uncharacterized protein (DUF1330 family)